MVIGCLCWRFHALSRSPCLISVLSPCALLPRYLSVVVTVSVAMLGVVVVIAQGPCPRAPGLCAHSAAAAEIFWQNAATLSKHKLAALRKACLQHGPSKTCRVPMLIGPSNTGKSTLLHLFGDLFGPKHVFHKPALGSTFALRNLAKGKRFILWDAYRPVESAHKDTVPVATVLCLFYREAHKGCKSPNRLAMGTLTSIGNAASWSLPRRRGFGS